MHVCSTIYCSMYIHYCFQRRPLVFFAQENNGGSGNKGGQRLMNMEDGMQRFRWSLYILCVLSGLCVKNFLFRIIANTLPGTRGGAVLEMEESHHTMSDDVVFWVRSIGGKTVALAVMEILGHYDYNPRVKSTGAPPPLTLPEEYNHNSPESPLQPPSSHLYEPRKQHHPTFYDDSPPFRGPLILSPRRSTSGTRQRIRYYSEQEILHTQSTQHAQYIQTPPKALHSSASTKRILETIVHSLVYHDAPIDVKEVVESIEFVLRTKNRLIHAVKQQQQQRLNMAASPCPPHTSSSLSIQVYDMCSGHGLTGLLLAACLYCTHWTTHNHVQPTLHVTLVDSRESTAFVLLESLVKQSCPWIQEVSIQFKAQPLNEFCSSQLWGDEESSCTTSIVVATHACGSLTDQVLDWAVNQVKASAIAVMPCCYTGTDRGMPYGLQRALGVSWSADVRRALLLQEHGYHVDLGCIPKEITPMNRILVGELKPRNAPLRGG